VTDSVIAIRYLTDEEALDVVRGLTGKPNATQLARQWGWNRSKIRRRLAAWQAAGHLPKARHRSTNAATTQSTNSVDHHRDPRADHGRDR